MAAFRSLALAGTLRDSGRPAGRDRMRRTGAHLASAAMDDVLWGLVGLRLHADILALLVVHLHPQDSEGGPAEIQGNEIPLF